MAVITPTKKQTEKEKAEQSKTQNPYTVGTPINPDAVDPNYDPITGQLSNVNLNNEIIEYQNVLSSYNSSTWNFSLYGLSAVDYKLFQINSDEHVQRYVIAQSGVTARYSISDVVMNGIQPGTPGQTTNNPIFNIDLTLTEQNGMNLFDDLNSMSNTLGYNKFADLPLVLDLKFIGYDESGVPVEIPDSRRYWMVQIITCEGSASETGSTMTYKMSLVPSRNTYPNRSWILQEPFECTVSTFGGFITELENKFNSMATEQYGYLKDVLPLFKNGKFYEFNVSDKLKNIPIVSDVKFDPETGAASSYALGSKTFRFEAKDNVGNVIDSVMDCCASYNADGRPDPTNRQFVQVVPSALYAGFDALRDTSAFKMIYYIVPYYTGDVKQVPDLTDDKFNVEYFLAHAPKYNDPNQNNEPKLQMRRYDFTNSGLNNEILSLDIRFDNQFYLAVTRNPYSVIDSSNSAGTHAAPIIEFGGQQYNTALGEDRGLLYQAASKIREKQKNGEQLTEAEKQFLRDADNSRDKSVATMEGDQAQQQNIPVSAGEDVYVEDFRDEYDLSNVMTNGIMKSIPTDSANIPQTNSSSVNSNSTPYEMYRRMARSNYYDRSFMINLDMTVVGDPYWIGWSDNVYYDYLKSALTAEQIELNEERNTANFITSESFLLLNLRPPTKISDDTGILDTVNETIFSQTIYRILQIDHTFGADGKFTQKIQGAVLIRSLRSSKQVDTSQNNN